MSFNVSLCRTSLRQSYQELGNGSPYILTVTDFNSFSFAQAEFVEGVAPVPTYDRTALIARAREIYDEEPMRILREERDRLIAETDWWVLPDRTPTDEQLAYRQVLRDLPSTATPVLDSNNILGISGVTWPTKP